MRTPEQSSKPNTGVPTEKGETRQSIALLTPIYGSLTINCLLFLNKERIETLTRNGKDNLRLVD